MVRFPMRKSQLKSIPYRLYVTKSRPSPFFILTNYISLMYMNSARSRRISEEIHICSKFAKQIVNSQCCDKKLQPNQTARNSLHIVPCLGKIGSSLCYQSRFRKNKMRTMGIETTTTMQKVSMVFTTPSSRWV